MKYFDLIKHWSDVEPHLTHPCVQETLVRDFGRFVANRFARTFLPLHQLPADFEVVDWHPKHTGPEPPYWRLVLVGACHSLVNFNLQLAQLTEPAQPWRIVTSRRHSTVWNGADVLFDPCYLAINIPADRCFKRARGKILEPGEQRHVGEFRRLVSPKAMPPSSVGPTPLAKAVPR